MVMPMHVDLQQNPHSQNYGQMFANPFRRNYGQMIANPIVIPGAMPNDVGGPWQGSVSQLVRQLSGEWSPIDTDAKPLNIWLGVQRLHLHAWLHLMVPK